MADFLFTKFLVSLICGADAVEDCFVEICGLQGANTGNGATAGGADSILQFAGVLAGL